ncbi:MAG: hypothetical protein IPO83_03335 [Chitinophagaceae bacterium]|nr:hypothetical protein [Chitinophagaceae bacterium]
MFNLPSNICNINRTAASRAASFTTTSGTPSEVADTVSANTITFTGLSGTSSIATIASGGGSSSTKSICNNTISVTGTHSGTSIGITSSFTNLGNFKNNSITISCASPTVTGFTSSATVATVSGNTFSLSSSTVSPTAMQGITLSGSGAHSVTNNSFSAMNFTGIVTSSPMISGIALSAGTLANIFNNTITNISIGAATSSASPVIDGILISGGSGINVFKNRIHGLSTLLPVQLRFISGIRISGGGATNANNIYNNLIGNLTAGGSFY